jgi:hypothetical protein
MTIQEQTPAPTPRAKEKGPPKSYTVRLTGTGAEEVLITAYQSKAGFVVSATTYASAYVKGQKRTGTRGASSTHPTLDAAKKAVEQAAAAFVKAGWVRPERKAFGGFVRKQDVFGLSNVPKPRKK